MAVHVTNVQISENNNNFLVIFMYVRHTIGYFVSETWWRSQAGGEGVGQEHNSGPLAAQKVQNIFLRVLSSAVGFQRPNTKDCRPSSLFFSKIHTTNPQEN
jgi:hypothetical protein